MEQVLLNALQAKKQAANWKLTRNQKKELFGEWIRALDVNDGFRQYFKKRYLFDLFQGTRISQLFHPQAIANSLDFFAVLKNHGEETVLFCTFGFCSKCAEVLNNESQNLVTEKMGVMISSGYKPGFETMESHFCSVDAIHIYQGLTNEERTQIAIQIFDS